jgi:predicted nucleic acid-binding protein
MRRLIEGDAEIAVTEPVVMELLAGARGDREARQIRVRLLALPLLRVEGLADYERAALIYQSCRRRGGDTIRSLVDCLIAGVAIREGAEVLHDDADFDAIARHTELQIHPL